MLRNYFVIATRNLLKSKLYSGINILGLSIGIACCLVLTLFVIYELNYDGHHKNAENIYRIVNRQTEGNQTNNVALTPGILGVEIKKQYAEIKAATRVSAYREYVFAGNNDAFEESVMAVDPDFFTVFTVPFAIDPGSEVISEHTALISEAASLRHFGKKHPAGETITIAGRDYKVGGVFKNFPAQSHLKGDVLFSFSWIEKTRRQSQTWESNWTYNYVLLDPKTDFRSFSKKVDALVHRNTPDSWKSYRYFLQPLLSIHTDDSFIGNPQPATGRTMLIAFSTVGAIILLLACVNYMNMATSRSAKRAVEVGVRKVMGAYRGQLIRQFMMESFLICTASFFLAILWADLAVPFFNDFLNLSVFGGDRQMKMSDFFSDFRLVSSLVACNILITLVAGSYPSFFLSRFLPAVVLKGRRISDASRKLRRGLVLSQFTITGVLVIMALVVFRQVNYIQSKDLGFNKDRMLLFASVLEPQMDPETFKSELLKIPGVKQLTSASNLPGRSLTITGLRTAGAPNEDEIKTGWMSADHDYIPTLQIDLVTGRNFNDNGSDRNKSVIINEQAAREMGWTPEDAIGKRISGLAYSDSLPAEVIGVIRNFHATSLRKEITPLVIEYAKKHARFMARVDGTDFPAIQSELKKSVVALLPGKPFESFVMTEYLDMIYQPEIKMGQLLTFLTVLALMIGCMGLYALSAYEAEQRIKELGIRRIMGASSRQLLIMLSRNFLKPVFWSLVIAMPLAYYVANLWLQRFPYHTSWSATIFVQSALCMLLLGWITVTAQGLRASRLNPADALRHE